MATEKPQPLNRPAGATQIGAMLVPALRFLAVGAAGLAAGWLGARYLHRRDESEVIGADAMPVETAGSRPVRTLVWCDVCRTYQVSGRADCQNPDCPRRD
jgi:hypothetical protein